MPSRFALYALGQVDPYLVGVPWPANLVVTPPQPLVIALGDGGGHRLRGREDGKRYPSESQALALSERVTKLARAVSAAAPALLAAVQAVLAEGRGHEVSASGRAAGHELRRASEDRNQGTHPYGHRSRLHPSVERSLMGAGVSGVGTLLLACALTVCQYLPAMSLGLSFDSGVVRAGHTSRPLRTCSTPTAPRSRHPRLYPLLSRSSSSNGHTSHLWRPVS